jgi:glycine cleavage system transcriptional repressor
MTTRFTNAYVLNVMSDDHPGIVSAVSGVIVELQGNIDACSQTVLSGYFTQILVVSFPAAIEPADLAAKVRGSCCNGALEVVARAYTPPAPAANPADVDRFVITAFGKDKPGIIHRFSQYLAGKDINIDDLYWDCKDQQFVLISQVEIPRHWDLCMLQTDLEQMGREEDFAVRLQHENIFVATNQLRLPGGHR